MKDSRVEFQKSRNYDHRNAKIHQNLDFKLFNFKPLLYFYYSR